MTPQKPAMTESYYVLTKDLVIDEVGGDWNSFADANGGDGARSEAVLGRTIWGFVNGFETMSFLNAIMFWCRIENTEFETTYRCDAPNQPRLFRMRLRCLDDGRFRISHRQITMAVPERNILLMNRADRVAKSRCSNCCKIQIGEEWLDPFAVAPPIDFPRAYNICPSCRGLENQQMHSNPSHDVVSIPRV